MYNLTESVAQMINARQGVEESVNEGIEEVSIGEATEGTYMTAEKLDSYSDQNTGDPCYDKLAMAAVCVTNDLHHIHLYARGKDFDTTHIMAAEYYEKAQGEIDLFAELAIEKFYFVPNLSQAASFLDWEVEGLSSYQYEEAVNSMKRVISNYLFYIQNSIQYSQEGEVKTQLEEIKRYWNKELNYKLYRR